MTKCSEWADRLGKGVNDENKRLPSSGVLRFGFAVAVIKD